MAENILKSSISRTGASRLKGKSAFPLHDHDFPEVFWVSGGRGLHLINGTRQPLHTGVLVFMRPADRHAFQSDRLGVQVQNVVIAPQWFSNFRQRHFPGDSAFWSGDSAIPLHRQLAPSQVARLDNEFAELGVSPCDGRATERFLLNLLHVTTPPSDEKQGAPLVPSWLEPALRQWAEPEAWAGGTDALVKLTARSPAHVARTVRSVTGKSPTELLNSHRMRHAAFLLTATDRKVSDIALECGCQSLGHFYALFERHHGCAPGAYRKLQPARPI